ncbi:hypothetical protein GCM10027294_20450 [Marinactinospora endophytica]
MTSEVLSSPGMAPSRSGCPSRSRIAAAGSTAIGIIRLRPIRCRIASALDVFFVFSGAAEDPPAAVDEELTAVPPV